MGLERYQLVVDSFKVDLINLARAFKYNEENLSILQDDEDTFKNKYPKCYEKLNKCAHNKDKRTAMEYGRDLVVSWLVEDTALIRFRRLGLNISLNGKDRNREILTAENISSASDYLLNHNGKTALIELICDYTGYWYKNGVCDLRDNKYLKLKEIEKDYSLLIGIDFQNSKYFCINVLNYDGNVKYIEKHKVYDKPVHSLEINLEIFDKFSFYNMSKSILGFIK